MVFTTNRTCMIGSHAMAVVDDHLKGRELERL
jgi:hypothetical protein